MKREDEELINHIAERLKSHEEKYDEGAWGNFVHFEKRHKTKSVNRWVSAAAIVLVILGAGLYFYIHPSTKNENTFQAHINNSSENILQKPATNYTKDTTLPASSTQSYAQVVVPPAQMITTYPVTLPDKANVISFMPQKDSAALQNMIEPGKNIMMPKADSSRVSQWAAANQKEDKNNLPEKEPQKADARQYATITNSNDYFESKPDNEHAQKWNMGLMVIPSVGNDSKLNLGYGVTVGYRLSKKLSINSGLAYTELSGSKNISGQETIASGNGRVLSSIDANVAGINLPVELRYHINDKLYVGAGVSALAVLSNKEQNHYVYNQMQYSDFVAKNGNLLKPESTIAASPDKHVTKEDIPASQINGKDFAGFMNFTFGFRQKLNKRKSISVEPFVSIPMSNDFSKQNIRFTDVGVRLKVGL